MKEHNNPKVHSEGLLWIVSAVDDFGVSLLKLTNSFKLLLLCLTCVCLVHFCGWSFRFLVFTCLLFIRGLRHRRELDRRR